MLKKIVLSVLLVGFTSVLVWGGINRTLAKTGEGDVSGGERAGQSQSQEGYRSQQHGAEDEVEQHGFVEGAAASQGNNGERNAGLASQGESANVAASNGNGYQGGRGGNGRGQGQGAGQGNEPLSEAEIQALHLALDDEYHALAVYQSVIETFGQVEPFVEIAQSEQRHIDALANHFEIYGLPVPENPWIGSIPAFESLSAACQAGAEAEVANAALYEQLLSMVDSSGLIQVFNNLSRASIESHLPQFEACR